MQRRIELVMLSNVEHPPGRYVISDADTGRVLLGPFHSIADGALMAQAIANQRRTGVLHRTVDGGGREVVRSQIFLPQEQRARR
jgi:hypothetical protein